MTDDSAVPDERYALVEARMDTVMKNVRRWLFVTLCCWGVMAILALIAALLIIFVELPQRSDVDVAAALIDTIVKLVNFLVIVLYVSGATAVGFYLWHMYLDRLLRNHQSTT